MMSDDWLSLDGAPDEIRDGRQILVRQGQEHAVVRFMRSIEDGDGQWIVWRQLAVHNADGFAIRMPAPTHYKLLDAVSQIGPRIEFHQADWIPGFAAFVDDGKKLTRDPNSRAFCVLNLGSFLAAIQTGDLSHEDLAREIADSMCHEVLHVIEKWCGIEFSEDRVNSLLEKYRAAALADTAS